MTETWGEMRPQAPREETEAWRGWCEPRVMQFEAKLPAQPSGQQASPRPPSVPLPADRTHISPAHAQQQMRCTVATVLGPHPRQFTVVIASLGGLQRLQAPHQRPAADPHSWPLATGLLPRCDPASLPTPGHACSGFLGPLIPPTPLTQALPRSLLMTITCHEE